MNFIYFIYSVFALLFINVLIYIYRNGIENLSKLISTNKELINISLAISAGAYAIALYNIEYQGKLVSNTLSYSDRVNKKPLKKSFDVLNLLWLQGEGAEIIDSYRNGKITNKQWAEEAKILIKKNKYEKHIVNVHSLYQDLILCVENNRCDKRTACRKFSGDINNFRLTYRRFLSEWQQLYKIDIKLILKKFSKKCKS